MDANEPGAAVLAIFDQLIDRIKQARPVRSDDKPLGGGVVYSMLVLGMPVDPQDYTNPWTPQGDIDVKGAVAQGSLPAPPPAAAAAATDAPPAPPPPDPRAARALAAAYKTSVLCNTLLQVTTDGTYLEYPTGRHLDFAYGSILAGMQPSTLDEAPDPKVEAAVAAARKVLFKPNDDGTVSTKQSDIYKKYQSNSMAFGQAKAAYAQAYAAARANPSQMAIWPIISGPLDQAVTQARNQLIGDGAQDVENALDTLASVGNSIQAHMIAQARELFDQWNLGLTGAVPSKTPYSFILPTGWADPDDDDDGWQKLTITSDSYRSYDVQNAMSQSQHSWLKKSSKTGGSAGLSIGFASFGGSGSVSTSNADSKTSTLTQSNNSFGNDAKSLTISLEYALCTMTTPGLTPDIFYCRDWYVKGAKKNCISDGTLESQANITDISKLPMLGMITRQFLAVRNVQISAQQWGSAGDVLTRAYGTSDDSSSSSSVGGSAGVSLGPLSFGASASHAQTSAQEQGTSFTARDSSSNFGSTFDGQTLCIPGTQIVAFLSDIVPACPPDDDPEFGTTASTAGSAASPAAAGAAQAASSPPASH